MNKYNCIVVDDDEIYRLTLQSYVNKFSNLNLIGVFENAEDALAILDNTTIDVAFLDIDLPGVSGLELRRRSQNIPACVFITSHPEHAIESFELETLDFIVKPLKFERFEQTIKRIETFMEIRSNALKYQNSIEENFLVIKDGYSKTKVNIADILYLEALKDYTILITNEKKHYVLQNIGTLLKDAHFVLFTRIHRSFAIQKKFIKKINTLDITMANNLNVPIGRSFKENLNLILEKL